MENSDLKKKKKKKKDSRLLKACLVHEVFLIISVYMRKQTLLNP